MKADIGLIGLAVMGENLVLNMAGHGFTVAVFNRTTSVVDNFISGRAAGKTIIGTHSVEELCCCPPYLFDLYFERAFGLHMDYRRLT